MACAALFANDAKDFFNEQSKAQTTRSPDHRYEARFSISYRALDGRQFRQEYGFVVQFTQLRAWIEPVGSLIEERRAAQGA